MKDTTKLPYNIQFFADGDGTSGQTTGTDGDTGNAGGEQNNTDAGNQSQQTQGNEGTNSGATEKTFTQAELTATAAKEKSQGKNSVLKIFGCKDEAEAKAQAAAFKKWQDDQKTLEQKAHDAQAANAAVEARAQAAENKLICITAGVTSESLDDALAIAVLKVSDDKDLAAVLAEMKTQPKYKGFFAEIGGGTGNSVDHKKQGAGGTDNIGARLAKARTATAPQKSTYFS